VTADSAAFRAERVTSDGTGRRIELVGVVAWVGAGLPPTTLASTKVLGGEDTVVAPGFIDLQVNVYYSGHDCAEGGGRHRVHRGTAARDGRHKLPATAITAPLDELARFPVACAEAGAR
jgi:N-acetylglucosamine-6-phosphate deacetylase